MKGITMSRAGLRVRTYVAVAIALIFMGCAKGNSSAPQFSSAAAHPADWSATHWVAFNQNHAQCTTCHGSYTVAADSGGIAKVSCFGCHHPNGPLHPAGWPDPAQHGATAKQAPSLTAGFSHCSACHGNLYDSPLSVPGGATFNCFTCHSKAPHPDKPWHGTTASGTNHASADPGNAAECAKCHLNGSNLDPNDLAFHGTAPAGTAPGCFNNTLCHGNNPGHIAGWANPLQHGFLGAMATPGATTGYAYCGTCHGTSFSGGAGTSCLACHTRAPHPDAPWTSASVSHVLTDQGNAGQCAQCHTNGANSSVHPTVIAPAGTAPGCFNNTLCHDKNI
jgi:hypothetical protein